MKAAGSYAMAMVLLAMAGNVRADLRSDYYQRAATRDRDAFQALDINHDGVVERAEIVGDNDFGPRFGDMDRNGDGVVTRDELALYIRDHYGIDEPGAAQASMATTHVDQPAASATASQQASAK
jgi:EF hand domain-containing protein